MAEQDENVAANLEPRKKEWYELQVSTVHITTYLNRLNKAAIPPEHIKISCFGDSFANTMIWYYSDKIIL